MIIDCCWCFAASGSVLPMKIDTVQRSRPAPEVHHFRPLMTYSSPSRTIEDWMFVASELATSGSVIEKHERISPASSGTSHSCCCDSVPYFARTSMFPVSGALQLKTSGPMRLCPICSARGAYSRFVSPAPQRSSGRKRFHRPAARAFSFSSSMTGGWKKGSPDSRTCSW
jgi:hypothetical protein